MAMNGISGTQAALTTQKTNNEKAVEELQGKLDALGEAQAKTPAKSTERTEMTTAATSAEIQAQIEALQKEKARNIEKMEKIEARIKDLAEEAKEEIKEAATKAEALTEENKAKADAALASSLDEYIAANKAKPGSMSKGDLSALIQKRLPDDSALAQCLSQFAQANEKIDEIDGLLSSLNLLITDTNLIDKEIASKQVAYEQCKAAEEAAAAKKSCDPIGFVAKDKDGVEARYDFIIDDGNFDTTSDFLGARDQWAEMQDLDADGNGTVDAKELQSKNIKMVKTTPDGKQEVVDIVEEFGEDFSVDLNSYKSGGTHEAVDQTADFDNDGLMDQQLLGTFNVNLGDDSDPVSGYNTLDDVDYLTSEYGITDDTSQTLNLGDGELSQEVNTHANFFAEYTQKSAELKTELAQGLSIAGITQATTDLLRQSTLNVGKTEANIFTQKLEQEIKAKEEAEEKEEAKKAEADEAKAEEAKKTEANQADAQEIEEDDDKDKEEL